MVVERKRSAYQPSSILCGGCMCLLPSKTCAVGVGPPLRYALDNTEGYFHIGRL